MIKNIFIGIRAYAGSFKLISELKLWKYFAIPIGISLVTALLIGIAAWSWSDDLGQLIARAWIWEWGAETFRTIGDIIGGLLIAVLGLIAYRHIVMALSAPFMSPVSEKIEAHSYLPTPKEKNIVTIVINFQYFGIGSFVSMTEVTLFVDKSYQK